MSTAVLDVGKTNVKLVVVDEDGRELSSVTRPNATRPGPPYPHCDVDAIWGWLIDELAGVARETPIDTLVPVAHGACSVLIDDDGLVLPVLDYEHDGPDSIHDAYAAAIDPFSETLTPLLPLGLNVGKQVYWQRHAFPDGFAEARHLLMWAQYWSWRLTGVVASEVTSLGCHTHLWRPGECETSAFARREGFDQLLPTVRPAWESLGPLRPEILRATGVDPNCRVLCGIHDSNASYLPHLIGQQPPFTVVSTGTWVICMAAGGDLDRLDEARDMLANVDATGAPVPCSRFMGGREFAAIAGEQDSDGEVRADDVQALIDAEIFALPSFAPDSGPYQGRQGRITGEIPDTPVARAALAALYCALVTDDCLNRMGAAGPIYVEGRFTKNPAYLGLLAALRPTQPVFAADEGTGTVSGAVHLVAWGAQGQSEKSEAAPATAMPITGIDAYARAWRRQT